jgi:hypothetical protein
VPGGRQFADGRRQRVRLDVGGDDLHALGGEPRGKGLAHPAARTGDDGNPAGELIR